MTIHVHLNAKTSPVSFKQLAYLTSDGQRNCPKHVEFYSKNKFEKVVHLVGFFIRIMTMHGHLNLKISPVGFKRLAYLTSDGQRNWSKYVEFIPKINLRN